MRFHLWGIRPDAPPLEPLVTPPSVAQRARTELPPLTARRHVDVEQHRPSAELPFLSRIAQSHGGVKASVAAVVEGVAALAAPTGASVAAASPIAEVSLSNPKVLRSAYGEPSLSGEVLLSEGHVYGEIATRPYTRSYGQTKSGPLRFRHGSEAPPSSVLSASLIQDLNASSPGAALDRMAKLSGSSTAFDAMAKSKEFFDPTEKDWWGLCAPWSWTSQHPKISALVDAPGPEGQRGKWFMGEWLSRADLGNWAMAVASPFIMYAAESPQAISVGKPGPIDLLKAANLIIDGKAGFVADVHNDAEKGTTETWNQPFFGAGVDAKVLGGAGAKAIRALAEADGWKPAKIYSVTIVGKYGVEVNDGYEGDPAEAKKTWNAYVAVDSEGRAAWGVMANDARLAKVQGLPIKHTDAPPDYIVALPRDILDDALENRESVLLDQHPRGKEARFFLGTVLPSAVSGVDRQKFEAAVGALPAGPIGASKALSLRLAHPGVANAYSPAQWDETFGARGLDAHSFGAIWK